MEVLTKNEMERILGGGYWVPLEDGSWIYVSGDEEDEDNDIIFG